MKKSDPKVFELAWERFDWKAVQEEIERNNLWEHRPEMAAAISDPGICSCPRCHVSYWCEGIRQRCVTCGAEYPTNWWSMLSAGVQHGRILAEPRHPMHKFHREGNYYRAIQYTRSEVFAWGVAHPDCNLDSRIVFGGLTDWIAVWAGGDYVKESEMVGGKVIGLARTGDEVLLYVEDDRPSGGVRHHDRLSVWCRDENRVAVGDRVWWQGQWVLWTPRGRGRGGPRNVRLPRSDTRTNEGLSTEVMPPDDAPAMPADTPAGQGPAGPAPASSPPRTEN